MWEEKPSGFTSVTWLQGQPSPCLAPSSLTSYAHRGEYPTPDARMVAETPGGGGGGVAVSAEGSGAFSHSNKPQALPSKRTRPKYREDEFESPLSSNIMYDRRVVRGNTYQAQVRDGARKAAIAWAEKRTLRTHEMEGKWYAYCHTYGLDSSYVLILRLRWSSTVAWPSVPHSPLIKPGCAYVPSLGGHHKSGAGGGPVT